MSVIYATFGREEPVLEVQHLDVAFGPKNGLHYVVRDFNLSLRRGETVGLVGESGAGKTVAARAMLRLLPPSASVTGSIRFAGEELVGRSDRELRPFRGSELAMVFQDPTRALNPTMRIGRQVTEGLRSNLHLGRRAAKTRALELLERVRLPEPRRRYDELPRQLSALMRQKVLIAIALSCSPKVVVADEPTARYDRTGQEEIMALLIDAQRELNTALVLVTHDIGLIAPQTDRLLVLCGGRVLERSRTKSIVNTARVPYTRLLLGSSPLLARQPPDSAPKASDPPLAVRHQPWMRPLPSPRSRPSLPRATAEIGCPFQPRCTSAQVHCREAAPPLKEYENGHEWACWFPLPAPVSRDR